VHASCVHRHGQRGRTNEAPRMQDCAQTQTAAAVRALQRAQERGARADCVMTWRMTCHCKPRLVPHAEAPSCL
jgi:hypothetical protein